MANLHIDIMTTAKSVLELVFPQTRATTVASSAICKNQDVIGIGIMCRSGFLPPVADSVYSKLGGIPAGSYANKALVATKVIDTVWEGNTFGIGRKIMIQNRDGLLTPDSARMKKRSDQFPAFAIHTDDRKFIGCKIFNLGSGVFFPVGAVQRLLLVSCHRGLNPQ